VKLFSLLVVALCALLLSAAAVSAHFGVDASGYSRVLFPLGTPVGPSMPVVFLLNDLSNGGQPVTDLDVVHERVLHVFIIGEDLRTAQHIHPEDFEDGLRWQEQGQYNVFATFPHPGRYLIFGQYTREGVTYRVQQIATADGNGTPMAFVPDYSRTQEASGYTITLDMPEELVTNELTRFSFRIEKDGQPVTTLEPRLGADAHLFLVNTALNITDHAHPYIPGHGTHIGSMPQRYRGPTLPFEETFPEAGTYALYLEFQHEGVAVPVVFHVKAEDPTPFPWRTVFFVLWGVGLLFVIALGYRFMRS